MTSLSQVERYWSAEAARFDDEADHGLRDPVVRAAWADRLRDWLPDPSLRVADLGCGTGSLSLLLAEQGHEVMAVDLSRHMIEGARAKSSSGHGAVQFVLADAGRPPFRAESFDIVLCRHVLWALPDPRGALEDWCQLLRPDGRLVAIEGRWLTPATEELGDAPPWNGGVPATTLIAALEPLFRSVEHVPLREDILWGKPITDERYAVIATQPK